MSRQRLSNEEFLEKLKIKNETIEALDKYERSNIKIKFKCKICGYIWEATPNHILRGTGCPMCSAIDRCTTNDEFVEKLHTVNPDIISLDEYKKNYIKICFKCKICDHIWYAKPFNVLNGTGCPICSEARRRKNRCVDLDDVLHCIENKNIVMIGDYTGVSNKSLFRCNNCGYEWSTYPFVLMRDVGCPKCAAKKNGDLYRKSQEQFIKEMESINPDVEIVGEYYNSHTKIECKCKICNDIFSASPTNLLRGKGCSHCNKSKGEKKIKQYLESNFITFEQQKTYNDLIGVGGGLLSYDFYLPKYNLLIEYQGEYHDGTANNQTVEMFERQQEHDKRKKEYDVEHNVNLLYIWYWNFERIEDIISNAINKTK